MVSRTGRVGGAQWVDDERAYNTAACLPVLPDAPFTFTA